MIQIDRGDLTQYVPESCEDPRDLRLFSEIFPDGLHGEWDLTAQLLAISGPLNQYFAWAWQRRLLPMWSMSGLDLRHACIAHADLQGCDFSCSDLRQADAAGVNLHSADLHESSWVGADMKRANLSRANLRHADFRNCDLRYALLVGADVFGADFSGSDMRWVRGLGLMSGSIVATFTGCRWE